MISINGRKIGMGVPPFIVAELSANHNGSIDTALETIRQAKASGAHAIKLQTYTADSMTLDLAHGEFLIKGGQWDGYSLYQLYKEASTPYEWHEALYEEARKLGITCFSTPFDEAAVDLLESLNSPLYKVASFEFLDIPLIRYICQTGKPMVLSTGMASRDQIDEVHEILQKENPNNFLLLHCVSAYPTPIENINLAVMTDMMSRYQCPIGLSDHTLGTQVSASAVALGACFIEKHFILDRTLGGHDSAFSIEPTELVELVATTSNVFKSLGQSDRYHSPAEEGSRQFKRSVYVVKDIKKGDAFTTDNLRRIRPGFGLDPKYYDEIIGSFSNADIKLGTPMSFDFIDGFS